MIEADPGFDAGRKQGIDESVVERKSRLVGCTASARQHARPGDGEAVGVDAEIAHQRNVFAIATIVITGDLAGVAVLHLAGHATIAVPDAVAAAVGMSRTFDLKARGRYPPGKVLAG